jgi:hypothetical protein
MERASKVLGKLNLPAGTVTQEALVCSAWAGAVGKKIAAHSRAANSCGRTWSSKWKTLIWQRQLSLRGQIVQDRGKRGRRCGRGHRISGGAPAACPHAPSTPYQAADEASDIADPVLRNIYRASRKRGLA